MNARKWLLGQRRLLRRSRVHATCYSSAPPGSKPSPSGQSPVIGEMQPARPMPNEYLHGSKINATMPTPTLASAGSLGRNQPLETANSASSGSPFIERTDTGMLKDSDQFAAETDGSQGKKRSNLSKFLWLLLFSGSAYAGGVAYSLKSDRFHDFFTDYVPWGQEAVYAIEDAHFSWSYPRAAETLTGRTNQRKHELRTGLTSDKQAAPRADWAASHAALADEHKAQTPEQAKFVPDETHDEPDPAAVPLPPVTENKNATEGPQAVEGEKTDVLEHRADETCSELYPESAQSQDASSSLLNVHKLSIPLSLIDIGKPGNDTIAMLVDRMNALIKVANEKGLLTEDVGPYFAFLKREVENLNDQVYSNANNIKNEYERMLEDQAKKFSDLALAHEQTYQEKLVHIEEQWREEFEKEIARLEQGYRQRLSSELASNENLADQKLTNELLEQALQLRRRWTRELNVRLEDERGSRLGQLAALQKQVKQVEQLSLETGTEFSTAINVQNLLTATRALRIAADASRPFAFEFQAVRQLTTDDKLVNTTLDTIPPETIEKGVASFSQLGDRFEKVAHEIRKVALLPDDPTTLGYATSWASSKLLFRKTGLPCGDDIESRLARAETYLKDSDLDKAAREINQLSGPAKEIARDWLEQARRKLEVQQALEVIAGLYPNHG